MAQALEHPVLRSSLAEPPETGTGQKRKRALASSFASPESSRRSKRSSVQQPAASSVQAPAADAEPQVFVDNAVNIAKAAHAQSAHPAEPAQDLDFSALEQATVEHPDPAEPSSASSTTAPALATMYPPLLKPQPIDETFASQVAPEPPHLANLPSYTGPPMSDSPPMQPAIGPLVDANGVQHAPPYAAPPGSKPAVGSEEWHKLRKDNHKEVERRRRETINEGIAELSKIVPGCEKNKGSILACAVQHINQLSSRLAAVTEKKTLENLLSDQAIKDQDAALEKVRAENEQLRLEVQEWRRLAEEHGLQLPSAKNGSEPDAGAGLDS